MDAGGECNMTYKTIIWKCDKPKCKHINRRRLERDERLNDDICDKCRKHIHEPVTEPIKPKTNKENE